MGKIEFYWKDLTEEKQKEILETFGDDQNWDVFPFCVIEYEEEE